MRTVGKLYWILVIFCSVNFSLFFTRMLRTLLTQNPAETLNYEVSSSMADKTINTLSHDETYAKLKNKEANDRNINPIENVKIKFKPTRKMKRKQTSYDDIYNELEKYLQRTYTEDPKLVDFLRKYWLVPPTPKTYSREETEHQYMGQAGQAGVVDEIFKGKSNGVYVESGAADGISSNTIFFEKFRNWTGVLIEPIPQMYNKLIGWKRNAWHLNACLSSNNRVERINFANFATLSGNLDSLNKWNSNLMKQYNVETVTVQCFPFHSILAALNFTDIDYFSLDVEGAEMQVLKTIDFSKVHIKVFTVEYRDGVNSLLKLRELREFFSKLGYEEWGIVTETKWKNGKPNDHEGLDVIFYKLS